MTTQVGCVCFDRQLQPCLKGISLVSLEISSRLQKKKQYYLRLVIIITNTNNNSLNDNHLTDEGKCFASLLIILRHP